MAKFRPQGDLNLAINGSRAHLGSETKDPFSLRVGCGGGRRKFESSVGIQRSSRGIRFPGFGSVCSMGRKAGSGAAERLNGDGGDSEEEDGFEKDELSCFRGLVLDISYRPVNVVCWRRAICLEFMEKVDVLEYYDQTVSSPRGSFYIPAVLRVPHLLQVVKRRRIKHCISRKNIFYRDNYTCQYCSSHDDLTIDHIMPVSRGGEWKWENLVTACSRCNSRKGQKTLEQANMKLNKIPKAPKDYDILAIPLTAAALRMLRLRKGVPEEWLQYLGKPSP